MNWSGNWQLKKDIKLKAQDLVGTQTALITFSMQLNCITRIINVLLNSSGLITTCL